MITRDDLFCVGRTFRTHGYKGELKVDFTLDEEDVIAQMPVFIEIDNIPVPFFPENLRGGVDNNAFIKFRDIDSDKAAEFLRNKNLYVIKADLAERLGCTPDDLSAFEAGYEGFRIVDAESGDLIGEVIGLEEGVEYDYLLVRLNDGEKEVSIPLVEDFITEISEDTGGEGGEIRVALPDGFLEI